MRTVLKRLLLTTAIGAVGFASAASAADLPSAYTKAPIVQAAYDWSGFYIGINGGGATGSVDWALDGTTGTGDEGSHNTTGGTVGAQFGYRWQTMGGWVFGFEAQGNWADFSGSNTSLVFGPGTTNQTTVNSFGLFTGQIGYAWDRALFYVNGGAAFTNNKFTSTTTGPLGGIDTLDDTRWGAAVGVGFEYAFAPNWTIGLQYDHLFMGTKDINDINNGGFIGDNIKQDVDVITARLNYKFGGY